MRKQEILERNSELNNAVEKELPVGWKADFFYTRNQNARIFITTRGLTDSPNEYDETGTMVSSDGRPRYTTELGELKRKVKEMVKARRELRALRLEFHVAKEDRLDFEK